MSGEAPAVPAYGGWRDLLIGAVLGLVLDGASLFAACAIFAKFEGGEMRGIGGVVWFGLIQLPANVTAALIFRGAGKPRIADGLWLIAALGLLLWGCCWGLMRGV